MNLGNLLWLLLFQQGEAGLGNLQRLLPIATTLGFWDFVQLSMGMITLVKQVGKTKLLQE